jgi:hypothetical protein
MKSAYAVRAGFAFGSMMLAFVSITAAEEVHCNSVSFMSRRCTMVFSKECVKKGQSAETCQTMRGYCHACTDQYVRCKTEVLAAKANNRCAPCNEAYGACLRTMRAAYIDVKPN